MMRLTRQMIENMAKILNRTFEKFKVNEGVGHEDPLLLLQRRP